MVKCDQRENVENFIPLFSTARWISVDSPFLLFSLARFLKKEQGNRVGRFIRVRVAGVEWFSTQHSIRDRWRIWTEGCAVFGIGIQWGAVTDLRTFCSIGWTNRENIGTGAARKKVNAPTRLCAPFFPRKVKIP